MILKELIKKRYNYVESYKEKDYKNVLIVESHNLYIDSTKLVAIRHKGRKNHSKVV